MAPDEMAGKKGHDQAAAVAEAIVSIEEAVRARDYLKTANLLMRMLGRLESSLWSFDNSPVRFTPMAEVQATRLAAAMTTWITDTDHKISRKVFFGIARYKRTISQIFEVSGYRGTYHLRSLFGSFQQQESGQQKLEAFEIPKLLLMVSINAMDDDLLRLMLRLDRSISFSLMMGFLSEQMLYTARAESIRAKILRQADLWLDVVPTEQQLNALGPAYMGCSYAVTPAKHDIKRAFNAAMSNWLKSQAVEPPRLAASTTVPARPRVVVFAEFYHESHAMHRCYGPSIEGLKDRFDVTLMVPKGSDSDALKQIAHRVVAFDFVANKVKEVCDQIMAFEPDILYFPSVGMRLSTILLSAMRFAPIQVMTFGHPATTKSPNIDYAILVEDQVGSVDTLDETVILRPSTKRHGHRPDGGKVAPSIRLQPDVVRLAVPAWSRKVTPDFLATCKLIAQEAENKVEVWLFPNAAGPLHQAIERRYEQLGPFKVLPRKGYRAYIEDLNQCDIFLSTFPFGATNGIIDASLQGLPILNMRGAEVHTQNDSHLAKRLNQPSWLSVDSKADYVGAALRLIDDHALRVQISRNILDGDPARAFIVDETEIPTDIADIFEGLLHCHSDIQQSGQHAVRYDALMAALKSKKAGR